MFDVQHSSDEDRWITMGIASNGNLIVVVHTYKEINETVSIRIISARKATQKEKKQYKE
ncbi:MAG: BrnT family toxin [Bacteroidetes bacterium]|nr:BrnT family toxin [Bacteroidota bacterium]MBU1113517.1 BrnT family toxin [Bacteroidota bacterium]MBU1797033.1 BrnT family toxin [Bacteroidota bacterium]